MRVIDHEPLAWFLFEEDGSYFLDANCSHSAFGYCYMVELLPDETARCKDEGRNYLSTLTHDIHYSAPVVIGSNSIYKDRNVSNRYSEKTKSAVKKWCENNERA